MKVELVFEEVETFQFNLADCERWLTNLCAIHNKELVELCLIFCSDTYLLEINRKHLNHNYFTDIITFNYCEEDSISGDLFISLDRVKDNAGQYNVEFSKELLRVVAHGVLHLIGFNDKNADDQKVMRAMENAAITLSCDYSII